MEARTAAVLLRIYTEEGKSHDGAPLHEAILLKARDLGLAGATVLRGPMSFGHSGRIRTAKLTDISAHLPLVIEIVDTSDKIETLLASFESMRDIGLVTRETVEVIHYSGAARSR